MHSRGFTLIEMMVVIAISAILVGFAVPSFQAMIARNRIADATSTLMSHLEYARMESSRRGDIVVLCRVANPNANPPVCTSAVVGTFDGNDWASGWAVFRKAAGNIDTTAVEPGDEVLFRHQVTGGGARVMIHSNIPGGERMAFQPRGTGATIGFATFALTYGTETAPVAVRPHGAIPLTTSGRCIPVSLVGQIKTAAPGTGTCPAA